MLPLIFLVAALVLFILGAINQPQPSRVNLVSAGLACYILSILAGRL